MRNIRQNNADWVSEHIKHLLSEQADQDELFESLGTAAESRLYFVTATFVSFEDKQNSARSIPLPKCIANFERFYVRMLSLMMNNYRRKFHLQPLTYAYVDYPFTKRKKSHSNLSEFQQMKRNRRLSKAHPETTPHIHSVMLIHPDVHDQFKSIIPRLEPLFQSLDTKNQSLDVQPLPTERDLVKAMNYSSALMRYAHPDLKETDLNFALPKSDSEPVYAKADWERNLEKTLAEDRAFRERNTDNWRANYFG